MWERFASYLRGTRLGTWSETNPLKAVGAACLAFVTVALAFGAWAPWPIVQSAAADFVGGMLAGLIIFGLANVAFGFTERRDRERRALRIAYDMLLPELLDNMRELDRMVGVLRAGSLDRRDPGLIGHGRLKVETWQLLVQSPLVANLPPDLIWRINFSYYDSRRGVDELRESDVVGAMAANRQAWKDLCDEYLPRFEGTRDFMLSTTEALQIASGVMVPDALVGN